jgi:ABC-type polysaccharide/polyol phosphate export permease
MIKKIKNLIKYRQLISTLVIRELKARYRGTALGYVWSFLNPLMLLLVYSVVFGVFLKAGSHRVEGLDIVGVDYAIFLFTGLLPWIWFSSSVLEASGVLFSHGNLIKKIKFPVEVLPIMTVLSNLVHFVLGLPILVLVIILLGKSISITFWVLCLPLAILLQLLFTLGFSMMVSALTVHFKDLKDILNNLLTLWFFGTPIIYPFGADVVQNSPWAKTILSLNPMTHIVEFYQYIFFFGKLPHWKKIPITFLIGTGFLIVGYLIFDKLRDTYVEEV